MKYREIKCNLPKNLANEFNEFLDELQVEGYYEILFDSSLPKTQEEGIIRDNTHINVYLGENDFEKELKIHIYLKTQSIEKYFIESRLVETREFEEAYKEFYKPFVIGDKFCIIPIWEKESIEAVKLLNESNRIALFMNPGMAFGTGHHETTKLMLSRMPKLVLPNDTILDMGTGSGILSVAAGLLGAKQIVAIDIDPNAVRAADYNWKENTFTNNTDITILEGGFDHSEISKYNYDLILANITFAVISQNIHRIEKIQSKHFLFSGIITEKREASIKLFHEVLGGELLYEEEFNGWMLLEWKR
jgi:ribosomal protein L11 methyltransferase